MNKLLKYIKTAFLYIRSSKTLMFNVVLGITGAIQLYSGFLRDFFESDKDFGLFMVLVATIGTILRAVTKEPLSQKVSERIQEEKDA